MSNVFIVQENPRLNMTPAMQYGALTEIFPCKELKVSSTDLAKVARMKLGNFDPAADYILFTGDPVAIAIVAGVLFESHAYFRALKFESYTGTYNIKEVNLK